MSDLVTAALGLTAWAVLHSALAADGVKRIARRFLGRFFLLYRLMYTVVATASLGALWHWLPRPGGVIYIVPPPWSWAARLIQLVATGAFIVAARQFSGSEFLGVEQLRRLGAPDEHDERLELNTSGLYGVVRHPLYATSMVAMAATPNMTVWWLMLTVWAVAYFWVGSFFEERRMAAALGNPYREYQRRVPRFVPRLFQRQT